MGSHSAPLPRRSRSIPWWVGLLAGILLGIVGVLLILSPVNTARYLFWILGIACIAGGVAALVSILFNRSSWGWKLLAGLLLGVVGLGLISQPLFGAYLVAAISLWILGALLLVAGTGLIIVGFSGFGWWYGIVGGLVIVIGALVVLASVIGPQKAPWLFGVAAILAGIGAVVASLKSRGGGQEPLPEPA